MVANESSAIYKKVLIDESRFPNSPIDSTSSLHSQECLQQCTYTKDCYLACYENGNSKCLLYRYYFFFVLNIKSISIFFSIECMSRIYLKRLEQELKKHVLLLLSRILSQARPSQEPQLTRLRIH